MANPTSKAKHDPLEAAKLGGDPAPQPRATTPATSSATDDLDAVVPAVAVETARRPKFRVVKAYRVSIRGTMCDFKVGRVLDSAGYDIDTLTAQGLQVELIKED